MFQISGFISLFYRNKVDPECWDPFNKTLLAWEKCVDDNELTADYVSLIYSNKEL